MKSSKNLKNQIIQAATIELAKLDVWEFCLYYDFDFFSKRSFLKLIAYSFQWVLQGENTPNHIKEYVKKEIAANNFYYNGETPKKIALSLPPRAGKSYTISVCCAWAMGKHPKESIMRNACTERLYNKFSYDTRDIIRKESFQDVFDVKLADDKQAVGGWNTQESKQVGYFGAGVGGTIIGFGASLLAITDDLYKSMEHALSPNTIEKVRRWKESAHDTRLEGGCKEIDIGTRWSNSDIIGETEENNEYDIIIRVPALANNVSFCNDVKTTDEYLAIKNKLSDFMWMAMYQQEPIEVEGVLFQKNKLNYFKLSEFNKDNVTSKIGVVDVADDGVDYFSFPIVNKAGDKWYLVDVIYTQDNLEVTKPISLAKIEDNGLDYVKVETNSQGKDYYRYLKANVTNTTTRGVWSVQNKETRILMQAGWIMDNVVFRSDYAPGSDYDLFMISLTRYMKMIKNQKDDAADSLAALAQFIKKLFGEV